MTSQRTLPILVSSTTQHRGTYSSSREEIDKFPNSQWNEHRNSTRNYQLLISYAHSGRHTSPTAIASCFFSGLASSTNFATLEYPVSPVVWAPLSDIKPDSRDSIEIEGAGDVFWSSSDGLVVVVAVDLSVDLEGTFDELSRRVMNDWGMRNELRPSGLNPDSERIPVEL